MTSVQMSNKEPEDMITYVKTDNASICTLFSCRSELFECLMCLNPVINNDPRSLCLLAITVPDKAAQSW